MAQWWIVELERGLRTVFGVDQAERPYPGLGMDEGDLDAKTRSHVAGLMRVNHTGEVCAQALYFGQALTHDRADIAAALRQMGLEEGDHLAWYRRRLLDLNDHVSCLSGFFYASSLLMGMLVGLAASKHGMAFVEETERQVTQHLQGHLEDKELQQDPISLRLVEVMQQDEIAHANTAQHLGSEPLPKPLRRLMKAMADAMIWATYRI